MVLRRVAEVRKERPLHQGKPLGGSSGRAEPLAELDSRGSPEGFDVDVRVRQLAGRRAEEREGATRFEVHAQDRLVLVRIDHEEPAVGPGEDGS